jgi:hypothetical protein
MTITYTIDETFNGKRSQTSPDPDNDGETITTEVDCRDVQVTFSSDAPAVSQTRTVNVCYDGDGAYDAAATLVRIGQQKDGFTHKVASGVIT